MNAVRTWSEGNGIEFPRRFFKNLNGKAQDAITEEHVPTNEELKRIVEYMPLQGKALTLVLSSSGMRPGEGVLLTKEDTDFTSDPVKVTVRAQVSKTGNS